MNLEDLEIKKEFKIGICIISDQGRFCYNVKIIPIVYFASITSMVYEKVELLKIKDIIRFFIC